MARLPTIDLDAIPLSNGDVASMLATRGIPVFPCAADRFGPTPERPKGDPEAKKPLTKHGFKDATCDSAMLAELWKRNPEALVGISLAENRLVVIDVDGGAEGVATWEAYCAEHGIPLAGVPIVITPTGGRHYYFRLPEGLEQGNGRGNLPPKAVLNVDVRAPIPGTSSPPAPSGPIGASTCPSAATSSLGSTRRRCPTRWLRSCKVGASTPMKLPSPRRLPSPW